MRFFGSRGALIINIADSSMKAYGDNGKVRFCGSASADTYVRRFTCFYVQSGCRMPCQSLLRTHIGCYLQEIASVLGKGNGFAVVGTHALGVGLQRALGAHLP